jgi:diguanylate cyclase (GGDEF)-like protein
MHAARSGMQEVMTRVLEEQAALYAARGRYRDAYECHIAFHRAREAFYSAERDARARTLHAVFETEEARRASRQFREMSVRDPLTGLYNRRYVDEVLPALLARSLGRSEGLAVALVDLDHFKQINDLVSHEAGDRVLVETAALLAEAAAPDGFAARLGGEEFLLVLPGTELTAATRACRRLCAAIRDRDWSGVVGDLRVTASAGVVASEGVVSPLDLLRTADRLLYLSKRSGRDRVTAPDDPHARATALDAPVSRRSRP